MTLVFVTMTLDVDKETNDPLSSDFRTYSLMDMTKLNNNSNFCHSSLSVAILIFVGSDRHSLLPGLLVRSHDRSHIFSGGPQLWGRRFLCHVPVSCHVCPHPGCAGHRLRGCFLHWVSPISKQGEQLFILAGKNKGWCGWDEKWVEFSFAYGRALSRNMLSGS